MLSMWSDVIAWDSVKVPMKDCESWPSRLRHCQTALLPGRAPGEPREGWTVWSLDWQGRSVGVGWRWATRGYQVVALADPMRIRSNVCWVLADGHEVTPAQSVVLLNEVVHALPWQAEVVRQSRRPRRLGAAGGLESWERRRQH